MRWRRQRAPADLDRELGDVRSIERPEAIIRAYTRVVESGPGAPEASGG